MQATREACKCGIASTGSGIANRLRRECFSSAGHRRLSHFHGNQLRRPFRWRVLYELLRFVELDTSAAARLVRGCS